MQHQISTSQEAMIERLMALGCNITHVKRLEKSWVSPLRVAFGGKTNAGKTTTVQALLAMMATDAEVKRTLAYFPVDVLSSTACPVVIGHSEQIAITIHFHETSKHSADLSVLRDLRIPENPDSGWSAPVWAEVYLPIDGLKRFQLCDTAGIGTVGEDFTKEQWGQVRKWASLVVWLTADVPGDLELARISDAIKSGGSVWLGRTCMDRIKWGQNPEYWNDVLRQCDASINRIPADERFAVRLPTFPLQSILASNIELGTGEKLLSDEDIEFIKQTAWNKLGDMGHRTPIPAEIKHLQRATVRELRSYPRATLALDSARERLRQSCGIDDLIRSLERSAQASSRRNLSHSCLETCVLSVMDRVDEKERTCLLQAVAEVTAASPAPLPRLAWKQICVAMDNLLDGNLVEAACRLQEAQKLDSASIEIEGFTVLAQAFIGDFDANSLSRFRSILAKNSDCVTALFGESLSLLMESDCVSALKSIVKASKLASELSLVKVTYVWASLRAGDYNAAAQVLSDQELLRRPMFRILASAVPIGMLVIHPAAMALDKAIEILESVSKQHSSSRFFREMLSIGHAHAGTTAPQPSAHAPNSSISTLIAQAEEFERQDRWQDATMSWHKVCQVQPTPLHQYRMGNACLKADRLDDATRFLKLAFDSEPGNEDFACRYASCFHLKEDWSEEIRIYKQALAVSPRNDVFHHNIAYALAESGNSTGAITHAKAALDLNNTDATRSLLSQLLYSVHEFSEARQLVQQNAGTTLEKCVESAYCALQYCDYGTALRICQELHGRGQSSDDSFLLHGLCLFGLGAFGEAWCFLESDLNSHSSDYRIVGLAGKSALFAMANNNAARIQPNGIDLLAKAVVYLDHAVKASVELGKEELDFLYHLGCVKHYWGKLDEAAMAFKRICQAGGEAVPFVDNSRFQHGASPRETFRSWSWGEVYFCLGMASTRLGRDKEARQAFDYAATHDNFYRDIPRPSMGLGGFLDRLMSSTYDTTVKQNIRFPELCALRYLEMANNS